MFESFRKIFEQKRKPSEEGLSQYEQEQQKKLRKKLQEGADISIDGVIDNINEALQLQENEDDIETSKIISEPEQEESEQKESAEKRGFFGAIGRKSKEAGKLVSETAREGAEGTKKIVSALRQNSELRKEIGKKLEVGAERWLSIKGGGDILKAFAGKGDLASLVRGIFEKGGEIQRAQEKVEIYGKVIEVHRGEFKDQVRMTRMERVLELLGKSEEEIAEITKDGYNNDAYLHYKHELEATGTYIVWARSEDIENKPDKLKETQARIESKHRADPEKAGIPVKVLIENDGRNDAFRDGLKQGIKDIRAATKESHGRHTRINRDSQEIVSRVLATIAAHSENREEETGRVMKANVEGVVNAWDETRDVVNTLLTASGRVELRAASGILTRIGKGAHEAVKTRTRDAITLGFEREKSRLLAHEDRYGARILQIQELRARVESGASLEDEENEEFLSGLMEFNRKYRGEAQLSLDDSEKPPFEEDKFVEFFKSNDIEKYLKQAESQYANSLDKLRVAHKGILEGGDEEHPEHGYFWYLKETVANKARSTARAFKIWENRSTLKQKQGAVRNLIGAGQAFGDIFRFMRFGHDAEELTENIIHGEVFGKEGGFLGYLQEGGQKLASRFYEDDLAHTLIARHLHRDDLSEDRREILASLQEKLSHGGKMSSEEQNFLHTLESQAREMHHKELSGEHLSEFERSAIWQAKHETAKEYDAKGVLEKIATNLGKHNIERSVSTVTELPYRLERIMHIAERGTGAVIANLDRAGARIASRAYGDDITALMFQKESVSGTRAMPEETRERLFHYFVGDIKRNELTSEDEQQLKSVEHEAAELFNKHKAGGELTEEETALIAAAEHKALIDYMDDDVFEKIAKSAPRIREALQGIPDHELRKDAETQLALIETDPKKFAEGLRVCGAGMMSFGSFGAYGKGGWEHIKKHKLKYGLFIAPFALALLLYEGHEHDWGVLDFLHLNDENDEIKTENDTLLLTKTPDGSNIIDIKWHASEKQKTISAGEISEREAFVPKKNEQDVYKSNNKSTCFVHPKKEKHGFLFQLGFAWNVKGISNGMFEYGDKNEDPKKMGELGMIMTESAVDKNTNFPFTVIKTGAAEVTIPFDGDHCSFSPESTENNPILTIKTTDGRPIKIEFDMSDPNNIWASVVEGALKNSAYRRIVQTDVLVADLHNYFDKDGNFIAEPEKAAPVSETPQPKQEVPEEKPKYATGEMPSPTGEPVSLADALIMYSHKVGATNAEIEAQIARCFKEKQYSAVQFPDAVRDIIVNAALEKTNAINADKHIDASDAQARKELANITNMIPRLQRALKGEGLTLDKTKEELMQAQTIDDLEKFIDRHEQKAKTMALERIRLIEDQRKEKEQKAREKKGDLEVKMPIIKPYFQSEAEHHPYGKGGMYVSPYQGEKAADIKKMEDQSEIWERRRLGTEEITPPSQEKITPPPPTIPEGAPKMQTPSGETITPPTTPHLLLQELSVGHESVAPEPTPPAFDVHGFLNDAQKISPQKFWTKESVTIDKISDASDEDAEEIFKSQVMQERCNVIPDAHLITVEDKQGSPVEKNMREMKIKDFFIPDARRIYEDKEGVERNWPASLGTALFQSGYELRIASAAYAFSDPTLKAEAGITTFRESRLFSVWFMEALRDVEPLKLFAREQTIRSDPKTFNLVIDDQGKRLENLTVLEYMHFQANMFRTLTNSKDGGAIRDVWIPNHIGAIDGPLLLAKFAGKNGDMVQFNITGGETPATWGEFDRVGIKIPKDIASQPEFKPSNTAEIPLNRVQFKDGALEIIAEEAPKEKEDKVLH